MLTFRIERWEDCYQEMSVLWASHWSEVAIDRKTKLDVDLDRYRKLASTGSLLVITARNEAELVGYFMAFLFPHMHYSSAGLMAFTDVYYLMPEYRGIEGVKFFCEITKLIKESGVCKAYLSHKAHLDIGPLFEALGWVLTDISYTKVF